MQAACLAALPPAPLPPQYPSPSPFPIFDKKLRELGVDPDALRDAQYKAAQRKYQATLQAYLQKRNACYAPLPAATALPPAPQPVAPQQPQ
jgi:hypothetical protein